MCQLEDLSVWIKLQERTDELSVSSDDREEQRRMALLVSVLSVSAVSQEDFETAHVSVVGAHVDRLVTICVCIMDGIREGFKDQLDARSMSVLARTM